MSASGPPPKGPPAGATPNPIDAPDVRRLLSELCALTRERPGDALRRALAERVERVRSQELKRGDAERRLAVLARDVWPHLRKDAAQRRLVGPAELDDPLDTD
ncbi:MAG: type II toxin-antitoxin system VapB family antitoxin [Myxococcota bacterium]